MSRAVVFGCSGLTLTEEERRFFTEADPFGFILFARNIDTPDQVRRLVDDMKSCVSNTAPPVLIDQEGGRVRRLRPPHWRDYAAPGVFADAYAADPEAAIEALTLSAWLMADDLFRLGIDVDCVPMLDVAQSDADPQVIGDRALGGDVATVVRLGAAMLDGVERAGVCGVMKHLPGHGRSVVDSHADLPRVTASRDTLDAVDFEAFRAFSDRLPMGMTGHLLFEAIDSEAPSTLSPVVVEQTIRRSIGFDGLLFTDDISMGALGGAVGERCRLAIDAGCDIALHCNGKMAEMQEICGEVGDLGPGAAARADRAATVRERLKADRQSPEPGEADRLGGILASMAA